MKVSMIAAMANNRVIGEGNKMPWHLPADLKHFKRVTMGKPVIMGRLTYESIGKALPGRLNIVVSSNRALSLSDATVVHSCDAALELAKEHISADVNQELAENEVMIIGGGTIYSHYLPMADTLYLTFIHSEISGDTQFPDYISYGNWQEISNEAHQADEKNRYDYSFVTLIKS